jgi:hypothetical protein
LGRADHRGERRPGKFSDECVRDLILYAQHESKLDVVDKNGESLRQTLTTVREQTGVTPDELIPPVDFPESLRYIYNRFRGLAAGRHQDPLSGKPLPLSEVEIAAFYGNRRIRPTLYELEVLRLLDIAFRNPGLQVVLPWDAD